MQRENPIHFLARRSGGTTIFHRIIYQLMDPGKEKEGPERGMRACVCVCMCVCVCVCVEGAGEGE